MSTFYEIPLYGAPQSFSIAVPVQGTQDAARYTMTFQYRDAPEAGWTLDISYAPGEPIVCGIPLVTGADLLGQYAYLNLGGHLMVVSEADPYAVPTFDNLGTGSHVYWVTEP